MKTAKNMYRKTRSTSLLHTKESSGLQKFSNPFPPAGRKTKDKRKIENQEQKDQLELQTVGIPPREEGSRKPHTTEKLHLGP
jgi:hypothetical protein